MLLLLSNLYPEVKSRITRPISFGEHSTDVNNTFELSLSHAPKTNRCAAVVIGEFVFIDGGEFSQLVWYCRPRTREYA
jgi:hypothetical protein